MPTTKRKTTTAKATKSKSKSSKTAKENKVVTTKTPKKSTTAKPKAKATPSTVKNSKAKAKASSGVKNKSTETGKPKTNVSSSKIAASQVSKDLEPHALDDEITEKVRQLIHLSREQGFLTYRDVDKALPKISDQPEELQNVISIFNNLEIKLMDSKDVEKFKKKKEETEEETARSNQSDMLDDPVRMYLKQMGKVTLLSRDKKLIFPKESKVPRLLH